VGRSIPSKWHSVAASRLHDLFRARRGGVSSRTGHPWQSQPLRSPPAEDRYPDDGHRDLGRPNPRFSVKPCGHRPPRPDHIRRTTLRICAHKNPDFGAYFHHRRGCAGIDPVVAELGEIFLDREVRRRQPPLATTRRHATSGGGSRMLAPDALTLVEGPRWLSRRPTALLPPACRMNRPIW